MAVFRATFLFRLGIVCALLLSGCSLLPSVLSEPKFQADALVGADTWSFTDITLRPSVQQALHAHEIMDLFDGPLQDAGADLHHLPTPSGRIVDFKKDVLPHLDGEVVVALTGPLDEPDFTVLVHTNDVNGTLGLLADDPQPRFVRDDRGVTRFESLSGPTAVAGYKNWVIYSESSALRDQALDRIDGKAGSPNLASDPRYRSVVDRLVGDRLGYGYLDVSPLLDRALVEDPRLASAVEGRGRLAYAFGFEPGPRPDVNVLGVRMEYIPDPPVAFPIPRSGDTLQAMDRLPKGSMLALGGPDLGIYAESLAAFSDDEDLPAEVQALLSQFAGPYALGVTAPARRPRDLSDASFDDVLGTLVGGLFFIARVAPDADTTQIADVVNTIADAALASDDVAANWQHEVVVDSDWLAINAVPPSASLDDLPEDLLASDTMYQWVRSGFLQNGSNAYINLEAFETILLGDLVSSDELAALKPFRAIGISAQTEPQGDGHARMTLLIVSE